MICLLHGYLLEGSGSNLWTRSIVKSLCQQGRSVHLMAQENHPERYDFISEARRHFPDRPPTTFHRAETRYPGACVLHKPALGDLLPVYVWDRYEEFSRVVPMVELSEEEIEDYVARNVSALLEIVEAHEITAIHANHAVLMSVVAQRVSEATGIPFAVMPHGSALEFVIRRDPRFRRRAGEAFAVARRIFVIGDEMRVRVVDALPPLERLEDRFSDLPLGVDTSEFEPVARSDRPRNIERLTGALAGLTTGRDLAQTDAMLARLQEARTTAALMESLVAAREYDGKAPDADLAAKLAAVDWQRDATLLYVGRLIASKGVQSVIAALPWILSTCPRLRLLVVGHGPLREPLEALLWALEHGNRSMVEAITTGGSALDGIPAGEHEDHASPGELPGYFARLRRDGTIDDYFDLARRLVRRDRVIFTGYLTHRELRHLFPCCDVAVFPSVVREAGPLVFLEALASGTFPLGTYFGGMKASIDALSSELPAEATELMKLDPEGHRTIEDIARQVPAALAVADGYRDRLSSIARKRYDWSSIARKLHAELESM